MFKFLFTLTCRNEKRKEEKQAEIMDAVRRAAINSRCVIIGETPLGTRIIVLGKPLVLPGSLQVYQRQIEDIMKAKER